jgi:hypothetical protein
MSALGSIAAADASPVGSPVRVAGVVVAVRQLGKMTFVVIKDAFTEIQVVVSGELQQSLKGVSCPFYATVSGVLQSRPAGDARAEAVHGALEVAANDVRVDGGQLLAKPLDGVLRFTSFLQSAGFSDVHTLVRAVAPACADILASDDLGAIIHLTRLLGPCRWYWLTNGSLHFGLSPGFVDDLKGCLAEGELLERTTFRENATSAYGTVAIASNTQDASFYWRTRHALALLGDDLLAAAVTRPKVDDVTVQALHEKLARGEALLQTVGGMGMGAITGRNFIEFDLNAHHMEQIVALFPSLQKRLASCPLEEQFEILWSLLGHDHVKAIFTSPDALELLTACVRAGLFSDYNVLRCIDTTALRSIQALTDGLNRTEALSQIHNLVSAVPSIAASSCYLMADVQRAGQDWRRCVGVAKRGLVSRLAFTAAALDAASDEEIADFCRALARKLRRLFVNTPVDEVFCRSALAELARRHAWVERVVGDWRGADLLFDMIHTTFGSGLVAYEEASQLYARVADCSHHWAEAGITFSGRRWNAEEGRFDLRPLWLYPSKNRAAVLAKSCSGICSARDVGLFQRPDHFQLTLVAPEGPSAGGTVQMYSHRDEKGRAIWVVRGLNPSEKVTIDGVSFTIEVLETLACLARDNGVSSLVFGDGAGLFNADSARVHIRAVIRRLAAASKRVSFDEPLRAFDFHGKPISIGFGWRVWSTD